MGIILGLLAGFFDSVKNVFAKKDTKEYSETTVNFVWMLFATLITLPLALFNIPGAFSLKLLIIFICVTLLDFFAYIFYLRSLKFSDLSLSLPMLALTPVFVLIISYLFFNETVTLLALVGIGLIIAGGYLLNVQKGNLSLLAPLENIVKNKGVRYMLFTSILWGFANSLHKLGVTESSPLFYTGVSYLLLTLLYLALLLYQNRKELRVLTQLKDMKVLAPVGILEGITALFQFASQGMIASSVITISLKRSSILFSALFGALFFKENIKNRLLPIGLILVGIVLVSL